jgi:hemoglobin-like flavoprotein
VPDNAEILQATLAAVCPDDEAADEFALDFYVTLFAANPGTVRMMFPPSMAAQRTKLVRAIADVVANTHDLEAIRPALEAMGRGHRRFGTRTPHYDAVEAALLETLAQHLGERWTDEVRDAWVEAYTVVATAMVEAAEAADVAGEPRWVDAEVVSVHRDHEGDVATVTVRADGPYLDGQVLSVTPKGQPGGWVDVTPTWTEEGLLSLHFSPLADHPSTLTLAHLEPGASVRLAPPEPTEPASDQEDTP